MLDKFTGAPGSAGEARAGPGGSLISEDLVVEGSLASKGAIEIVGQVQGNVQGRTVRLRHQGKVRGNIRGDRIDADGRVDGDIMAAEVLLSPSADVSGTIVYDKLTIEAGATVNGKLRREPARPGAQVKGTAAK